MFKEPKVNVIESDEGFSVEILGRTRLKYTHGKQSVIIESEVMSGTPQLAIYAYTINTWDTGEPINDESKKLILSNIQRAFQFRNIEINIIE